VRWVESDNEWELDLAHLVAGVGDLPPAERNSLGGTCISTEKIRAKIILSCVGALVEARDVPKIPGTEAFKGKIVHSSHWDPVIDVKGKDIIVVGSGSTASQIVPALINPDFGAKSVLNVMRSPPWVEPTMNPDGAAFWDKWIPRLCKTVPGYQKIMRKIVFATMELEFNAIFSTDEKARLNRQKKAELLLTYLRSAVPEKYHEQLTPDYEVFCKRRVMGENWFRSLHDDRVELSTLPLTSLREHSAVLGPGRMYPAQSKTESLVPNDECEYPADIIIFANGYDAGNWLHPLKVYGRAGASLHDVWRERGGPQAYLGQAMDGFPNFFIIHGPNTITGHSSVILASEMMIQHALHFIPHILNGNIDACEVKKEAEVQWTDDIQARLKRSVWLSGGCSSWYNKDGWNATVYPRSQIHFAYRCKNPRFTDWNAIYTKNGIATYRRRLGIGLPEMVSNFPAPTAQALLKEKAQTSETPQVQQLPSTSAAVESNCRPESRPSTLVRMNSSYTRSSLGLSTASSGSSSPLEISEAITPPDAHTVVAASDIPLAAIPPLDVGAKILSQHGAAKVAVQYPAIIDHDYYESPLA